ncbi:hypothetical protein B0H14DRAFT_2607523 [Mycena olivaceomarginata]|nr:hypothetical protein B0H14DRAFT_2607523 [Mycena olivaceomarginata]
MVRILSVLSITVACAMAMPTPGYSGYQDGNKNVQSNNNQSNNQSSSQSSDQSSSQSGNQNRNDDCNALLLQTIFDVANVQNLLGSITSGLSSSNNLSDTSAAAVVQVGVNSMTSSIFEILQDISNAQTINASPVDQIGDAVNVVSDALQFIKDPNVNGTISQALDILPRVLDNSGIILSTCNK